LGLGTIPVQPPSLPIPKSELPGGCSIPSFLELPRAANCEIRSLCGFKDNTVTVAPLRCNSWGCLRCAARMTTIWANRVAEVQPERMVTFTKIGGTRDEIRLGFQHIMRRLRSEGYDFEYWGVVELHISLLPHMHVVQKGSYIPKKALQWAVKREGWGHCDIRKVSSGWSATHYCAKHLCHSHGRRWDGRLIRYSRKFFPRTKADEMAELKDDSVDWAMVFGRADCVADILREKGFAVKQNDLGVDWLAGEAQVAGAVKQTRCRSGHMGYGLVASDKIDEMVLTRRGIEK
jgi:hypothetical protein